MLVDYGEISQALRTFPIDIDGPWWPMALSMLGLVDLLHLSCKFFWIQLMWSNGFHGQQFSLHVSCEFFGLPLNLVKTSQDFSISQCLVPRHQLVSATTTSDSEQQAETPASDTQQQPRIGQEQRATSRNCKQQKRNKNNTSDVVFDIYNIYNITDISVF